MRRSSNCSYPVLQISTSMSGALQRNITDIRAQILSLSGGGVHSSHLIETSARRCSVLPLARLGCPWVVSMTCKVYKAPSAFPFIEHMVTPTGFLRLILVCRLKAIRLEAMLMLICQASIRLIFRNIRLMRCFGSSCYFQSTKEVKVSDLHRNVAVYNSHAIDYINHIMCWSGPAPVHPRPTHNASQRYSRTQCSYPRA
jgi:hypothetical protein